MATIINASNSTGLTLTSDLSGALNLQSAGNNVLTVDSTQNVGIGTTSPSFKLDVQSSTGDCAIRSKSNGGGGAGRFIADGNGSGSYPGISFSQSGTNYWTIQQRGDTNLYLYREAGSGNTLIPSGSLSVGTTSTGGQITVVGTSTVALDARTTTTSDIYYTWGNTGGSAGTAVYVMPIRTGSTATLQGGLYWNGSVLSLATSSDYRLKENVAPLQDGLEKIAQLNPVSYTWKESGNQGKGFIAHELQAVIPEAVVGEKDAIDEKGNIKPQSIDQTQIIVYLTKAVQELKAEIDLLKAGA